MKKGVTLLFILLLVSVLAFSVLAQNDGEGTTMQGNEIDKAYTCLENKVEGKCDTLTAEEQAFALLALAYDSGIQSECKADLKDNSKDNECWPKSGCKLRETALAVLALNYVSSDASDAEDWLLTKNKTPSDLTWYLQIDADDATSCKLTYSGNVLFSFEYPFPFSPLN